MRILIYSANFAPEPVGIGKYSGEMASWLAARGHQLRVVAAPPYYPGWKVREDYKANTLYFREQWCGMTIWRAPLWVPSNPSGLTRIMHLTSFAVTSLPLMLSQIFWRPQVVITVAPAFMCAPAGWLTARLCRAQAWLHLQDFEVDIAFRLKMLKSALLRRIAFWMERWMLRRFDSVSSISHRMVERLIKKGVPKSRAHFFPNWVDVSLIHPRCNGASYRAEIGISADAVVALYSGTLSAKQGLMIIPAVAAQLAGRTDIVFVICGDGVMKAELESECEGMANLYLLPLQPFERLGDLLCMADIHLLPQTGDAADLVLPSKLSGMLASGRPVISTCRSGTELEAVVSQCGLVVPPGDQTGLADAVVSLADDAISRLELGRRARTWAERNIERDAILRKMFGDLDSEEIAETLAADESRKDKDKEDAVIDGSEEDVDTVARI